ncbi:hypothetical protein quinque_007178 [Culex quinquefasciatus]
MSLLRLQMCSLCQQMCSLRQQMEQVCTTGPDRSPVSGPARNQFSAGKNVTKGPDHHQDGVSRTNAERIHTAQNRSPISAGTDAGKTIASGRNR